MTDTGIELIIEQPESSPSFLSRWMRSTFTYPLLYLMAIAVSEALIAFLHPSPGLAIHGILLVVLLLHASFTASAVNQRLFLAIAFAPLIRILSLTLPLDYFINASWYGLVGVPLAVAAYFAVRASGLSWRSLGINARFPLLQPLIALFGIAFGLISYLIVKPEPFARDLSQQEVWLPVLFLLIFTGILEEFIFRGLMQTAATQTFGRFGFMYIAILFTVMHLNQRAPRELFFILFVGIFLGAVVQATGSILGAVLAHGLMNITQYLAYLTSLGVISAQSPSHPAAFLSKVFAAPPGIWLEVQRWVQQIFG